ncbi:MAG: hypothetical protein GX660_05855 [Clostridiaceae bacterium]|nr:hypothetical protein [Clostridiaceae bacterium]
MNLSSKQQLYQDILLSENFFLVKEYGYQYSSININSETGKVIIVFSEKSIKREVEFCFMPLNARMEEHDLIIVNIARDKNSFFNLQDYLRYKNIEGFSKILRNTPDEYYDELRKKNPFYLVNIEGDFEHRLKYFLSYIEKLTDKYLRKILEGKDWEEIPFDWGPYK